MANQFLIKNTMADMRALSTAEVTALTNGTYNGVQLLGYYQAVDTPNPIVYLFSTTNDADNGGSIIATGGIKLVHQFSEIVDVTYFGAKGDDIADDTLPIQAALDLGLGISFRKGKIYRIKSYNPNGAPNLEDHLTNAGGISILSNSVVNGNGVTLKAITENTDLPCPDFYLWYTGGNRISWAGTHRLLLCRTQGWLFSGELSW